MTKRGSQHSLGRTLSLVLRRRDWLLAKLFAGAGVLLLASALWYIWPYWQLSGHFATLPTVQPSRLYARPFRLFLGERLTPEGLAQRLTGLHYTPAVDGELEPGRFRASAQQVAVYRRHFPAATADRGGDLLVVEFDGGRVIGLARAEHPVRELVGDRDVAGRRLDVLERSAAVRSALYLALVLMEQRHGLDQRQVLSVIAARARLVVEERELWREGIGD